MRRDLDFYFDLGIVPALIRQLRVDVWRDRDILPSLNRRSPQSIRIQHRLGEVGDIESFTRPAIGLSGKLIHGCNPH